MGYRFGKNLVVQGNFIFKTDSKGEIGDNQVALKKRRGINPLSRNIKAQSILKMAVP
jgi:hypothetical protein